jgi:hypothetical protein
LHNKGVKSILIEELDTSLEIFFKGYNIFFGCFPTRNENFMSSQIGGIHNLIVLGFPLWNPKKNVILI